MKNLELSAETRTIRGKKLQNLRENFLIPGIVYGHGFTNRLVTVNSVAFSKLFAEAGESTLVNLRIDKTAPIQVLIHDIQRDPVTSQISHIDFFQVKMTEKLTAHVLIVFDGETKAVKELGGTLVKALDHLTVECLPADLVHELHADLTKLEKFGDSITVADIKVPAGLTIKNEMTDMVATVKAPKTEEELAAELAAPVSADVTAVEVEKKGKTEEVPESESTPAP